MSRTSTRKSAVNSAPVILEAAPAATETATKAPVTAQQREYIKLRRNAANQVGYQAWDDAVKALVPQDATPEQWVEAARAATVVCPKCGGSGHYVVVDFNTGVLVVKGDCYRCAGHGKQGQADFTRNTNYDNYFMKGQ